jgi:hypothetical protein
LARCARHPLSGLRRTSPFAGGRINRSMLSCRDMAPWLSIHSPTAPRGEGGAVRHQRGMHFRRPQGGCMVLYKLAPSINLNGALHGSCPLSEATQPFYTTLGTQGQRPGGWLNPHARKGVSTYGNTGKHRPDPGPDPDHAISPIKKAALRQQVDYCLFRDASSSKAQEISSCFSSSIITSFSTCCSFIVVSASIKRTRFTTGCNKYFVYV